MKIQDILFFTLLAVFVLNKKKQWLLKAGLFCFFLAMPLFYWKIFFTAQRLVWYGAGFIVYYLLISCKLISNLLTEQ